MSCAEVDIDVNGLDLVPDTLYPVHFELNVNFKMKILFSNSKKDWIPFIEKGFELSQHEIFFAELISSDINSFDLVVPLTIQDLSYLNQIPSLLANNAIPIPTIASILLCNNKYLLNQALVIKGFSDFIPKIGFTHQYPYVLKKTN